MYNVVNFRKDVAILSELYTKEVVKLTNMPKQNYVNINSKNIDGSKRSSMEFLNYKVLVIKHMQFKDLRSDLLIKFLSFPFGVVSFGLLLQSINSQLSDYHIMLQLVELQIMRMQAHIHNQVTGLPFIPKSILVLV